MAIMDYRIASRPLELLAHDATKGTFTGHAVIWEHANQHREVFRRGAFQGDLMERGNRRKLLRQHDPLLVIGSIEAREDDTGLRVEGRLNLDVPMGAETHALLRAGDLDEMSIGFIVPEDGDDFESGFRVVTRAELWEVSLVTFASEALAVVDQVRRQPDQFTPDPEPKPAPEPEQALAATMQLRAREILDLCRRHQ